MSNIIHPTKSFDDQPDQNPTKDNDSPLESNLSIDDTNNNSSISEQYTKQSNDKFYDIIKSQSEEIESLLNQRAGIMSLFQKFDNLNSKSDDIIESLTQQLNESNQQKTEIQNKLIELTDSDQNQKDNLSDVYYLLLKKSPREVLQKIDGKKCTQEQDSQYQEIIDLFDEICNQYSISKKSKQREMVLLSHLKNALLFVNNIISSNSLQQTNENKTLIMTQIARINHFIGENYEIEELKPVVSLFQQNKPEDQIKTIQTFLDKQDDENEEESKEIEINEDDYIPFNELYTLFYGVIEVNNLLFSQLDLVNENIFNTASGISLKKKVFELEEDYNQANAKLENIANLLSNTSIEQSGDVLEMVEKLVQKYNYYDQQHSINSINEDNRINFTDDSLESQSLQSSLNQINATPNNQDHNSAFYKTQQKVSQRAVAILCSQNQENLDKLNYSKAMIQKLKKTIAQEKKKYSDYEKSSNMQINKLKSAINKLKKENLKKENQIKKLSTDLQNLVEQNKELLDNNKELINQTNNQKTEEQKEEEDSLQMKLRSITNDNDQTQYSQIQTQTEDQIPDEANIKLQQRITSLENECSELQSNIDSLTRAKKEILSQNVKLKVSEKTLKLKISQMEDFIRYRDDQTKIQYQIREISMNTQKDLKIKELNDQIKNYEFLLKNFVETYFPSIEITKETKYNEIISELEQAIMNSNLFFSQETLKDADEIRKQLNLKKTDSILDSFIQMKDQNEKQSKKLKQLNDEKAAFSDEMKEAKSNVDKMIRYKTKLDEWNKWAVSIYTQISGVISSSFSPADIRRALEEILMSAIGHRTLLGKLDILRSEKIYLTKYDGKISNSISSQKNSKISIRPLIYILIFTRKIQKLTSCLSISYIPFVINQPRTKKEVSLSPESSLI